jgi:YD repeat-containing protein
VGSPAFFTHRYTYDILDKLVTDDEDAAGSTPARLITQYRYDGNRNRVQIMEPAGNVTLFQYDERNLRLKMTQGAGTPEAATSTFNYDPNRNVTSLTSPRNLTTMLQYDGFDRNLKTIDAVGGQTVTHYDPAGNAVSVSALGQPGGPSPADNSGAGNVLLRLETYAYDELNRRFQSDQQPVNGTSFVASGVSTGRPPNVVPGGLNPPAISRRRSTTGTTAWSPQSTTTAAPIPHRGTA